MDSGSQDRNLPASERKLKKARADGQVSRSEGLSHFAILGAGAFAVLALSPELFEQLRVDMSRQLSFDSTAVMNTHAMLARLGPAMVIGLGGCLVFAAIIAAAAVASALLSGGWVSSLTPLMPDFSRINPLSGLSNLVSKKKLINVAKMMLVTSILFAIAAVFLRNGMGTLSSLVLQPSSSAIAHLTQWLTGGMGLLLLVVFLVAMVDVPLQAFLHREEMKMSHQELKEEGKESDGNPQVKNKIRQKQRELAQKRSVNAVPKADFVVMNPTHFAVAIRYDEKTMRAPQVISKGTDLLALRIRDIAKNHAIPVLQSPMLARALYANAELDQDIPSVLFTAVAQVLVYIYRLKAAMRGEGPMPTEVPQPQIPVELDPLHKAAKVVSP